MNRVTVEFFGICTFVSPERLPRLRVPQRVVLVNGTDTEVRHLRIPSHKAVLLRPDGESILLQGVHLKLVVESPVPPPFSAHLETLPQLTALMKEIEPLSPPSHKVVLEPTASEVSCLFDITFGTLTVRSTNHQAAYTRLTAESEGTFVLEAEPLPGGRLPDHLERRTPLAGHTVLSVANVDVDPSKKTMLDFLLHYKTAAQMPEVPQIPQMATPQTMATQPPAQHPFHTIGSGCSNSNYP